MGYTALKIQREKYSDLTEESLCELAQQGDRFAEEALILRCTRLVRACCRPFFLMGGDQEDLMQEGMMGLVKAIQDFDFQRGAAFRTFAETCVRNRIVSAIRSAAGSHHIPLNDSVSIETPLLEKNSALETIDPEELYISKETVWEQLQHLREKSSGFESQVLEWYLHGLSITEIAEHVHRPRKSVDNAIQRLRRKFDANKG